MKKVILLAFLLVLGLQSQAVVDINANWSETAEVQQFSSEMSTSDMDLDDFLSMTPKKFKQKTGKKLGVKKSLQLKAAQRAIKKKMKKMKKAGNEDISSGLYVLLAILGLGWVAMGVMDDWSGNNWIVNIILTVLCWLPGLIHALAKKKDYY
jgi:uncharacterized membrane protein YqaE (UPF0057 family)